MTEPLSFGLPAHAVNALRGMFQGWPQIQHFIANHKLRVYKIVMNFIDYGLSEIDKR